MRTSSWSAIRSVRLLLMAKPRHGLHDGLRILLMRRQRAGDHLGPDALDAGERVHVGARLARRGTADERQNRRWQRRREQGQILRFVCHRIEPAADECRGCKPRTGSPGNPGLLGETFVSEEILIGIEPLGPISVTISPASIARSTPRTSHCPDRQTPARSRVTSGALFRSMISDGAAFKIWNKCCEALWRTLYRYATM